MTDFCLFRISYLVIASYFMLTSSPVSVFIVYLNRNMRLLDFIARDNMEDPSKPYKIGISQPKF